MKVNILTSRTGGPLRWGEDLARVLNDRQVDARHLHTLPALTRGFFYQDADIVHTSIPFPFKLWQRPVVVTIKGEYTMEQNIWQRFYPKTVARADAITVPSQYLKGKLELHNSTVIPNALFPAQFTIVKHAPKEHLNLVSVTNFHFSGKAEGVPNIVNVLDRLQNNRLGYTVIGGGKYLDSVRNQVQGTNANIKFTGFLPDPRPSLAASDIFLYYSLHDNFPNVILEAMASGLPVVTNNVGAVAEVIDSGVNGYVAGSDETYLEYLQELVNSPELRRNIGGNARQTVEEKFDWSKVIHSYIEIYNTLQPGIDGNTS